MRILITTWPAYGHLLPMLPLARAAQRAGHEVVIASGAELVSDVERRGFTCWQVGPSRAESDAAYRARCRDIEGMTSWQRVIDAVAGMFIPAAEQRAEELVARAMDWKPDLVVHELGELAGAVAAAHTGARHVVHGLGQLPPGVWQLFAPGLPALGQRCDVPDLADRVLDAVYLDPCPPSLQPSGPAEFRRVQPVRPTAGEVLPDERLPWDGAVLDALPHRDTVYLTLGTIFHGMTEVFEAALAGLQALPINVVITVGPNADPRWLGPQPPHVLVADFVPQARLLPHCRLVISHGGAGTLTGALCHGLPQLILPQGADNFLNAAACERVDAALALQPGQVTAAAVTTAVRRLLAEPSFGAAARAIQAEIDAMPHADTVLTALTAEQPRPHLHRHCRLPASDSPPPRRLEANHDHHLHRPQGTLYPRDPDHGRWQPGRLQGRRAPRRP